MDEATPRRHTRHKLELPATILDEQGASPGFVLFDTADLSLGGAFLRSTLLLELDDVVRLELTLADGRTLRVSCRIVRVSSGELPGMGIAFEGLGAGERQILRELLAAR